MKSFKFFFSKTVWILLALILVLAGIGCAWNIYNFIYFINENFFKSVLYILIILLTLFLIVVDISLAINCSYVIKGDCLYTVFGIFRSKIKISDIVEITLFKKSNKLVIYLSSAEFSVIVISPNDYDEFILSIRNINKQIIYDTKTEGEDTPEIK